MNNIDLLRKRDESIIKYGKEPDYLIVNEKYKNELIGEYMEEFEYFIPVLFYNVPIIWSKEIDDIVIGFK